MPATAMAVMRSPSALLLVLLTLLSFSSAHIVMTYPGWRGDSLHSNGTTDQTNGLIEMTIESGDKLYPYGMEWEYPCGGLGTTTNRTKWPVNGGGVGFQPGWFPGHSQGMFYINLGQGTQPPNMSNVMVGPIGFTGPTNDPYPNSSICMPQLPLPANYGPVKVGDNATIQVVMLAQHGAALYSCVDITFADPKDVAEMNRSNCQNTSDIGFTTLFTAAGCTAQSGAWPAIPAPLKFAWVPALVTLAWAVL